MSCERCKPAEKRPIVYFRPRHAWGLILALAVAALAIQLRWILP